MYWQHKLKRLNRSCICFFLSFLNSPNSSNNLHAIITTMIQDRWCNSSNCCFYALSSCLRLSFFSPVQPFDSLYFLWANKKSRSIQCSMWLNTLICIFCMASDRHEWVDTIYWFSNGFHNSIFIVSIIDRQYHAVATETITVTLIRTSFRPDSSNI